MIPEVIKGFSESVVLDDSIIDSVFASAQKIVIKMKEMSEAQRGLELNKAGASAGLFSSIFETTKTLLELFAQLATYKPLDDLIMSAVGNDLQKLLIWGDSLIALGESGIAKFDTLQSVIARMAASMTGAMRGINALTTGGAGITANIQSQNGAALVSGGGQAAGTTVVYETNVYITAQGSISTEGEFSDLINRRIDEQLKRREAALRLQSLS